MNRQENIFIAKRMLVDNIYRSAKLEGLAVTYAQTLDIIENVATDVKPSEVNDVINLKNAWKYILDNLDSELDLALIKNCHTYIGHGMDIPLYEIGEFRRSGVAVSGTTLRPEEPDTERLHQELLEIKKIDDVKDRAITLFGWTMRNQIFRDGNKRIANLVSNFELIKHGVGIISVPEKNISEFRTLLVDFYISNDISNLKSFIEYKCFYDDMEFLSMEDREMSAQEIKQTQTGMKLGY